MYENYWGLSEPPFTLTPDPRFMLLTRGYESASLLLHYAIESRKAAALLCGDLGLGKTSLAAKLLEWLDPKRYRSAHLSNPNLTPTQVLQALGLQLGATSAKTRQAASKSLIEQVDHLSGAGLRSVIIIDDAHSASPKVLQELLQLLSQTALGEFPFTLVLLGEMSSLDKVERVPNLAQLITIRSILHPLDVHETARVIEHRLRVAGYKGDALPFTPDAIYEVHRYSNGVPRLISQAADEVLLAGALRKVRKIDGLLAHEVLTEEPIREVA